MVIFTLEFKYDILINPPEPDPLLLRLLPPAAEKVQEPKPYKLVV
jgi:hypothetical protein